MAKFEDLAVQIHLGSNIDQMKHEIAMYIRCQLDNRRGSLGTWECMYFEHAVRNLHHNIKGSHQPNKNWLMLSLVNAHKACCPKSERNETNVQPGDVLWNTYDSISRNLTLTGLE